MSPSELLRDKANEALGLPLAMAEVGKCVRLMAVQSGRELQARLAEMGLTPGIEMEVIRNEARGPCIVAVRGSRVMLGRGMAHRITVR